MIRIAGITLPPQKRIVIALTYLHGIGRTRSEKILEAIQLDQSIRSKDVPEAKVQQLREFIEKNYKLEGDLRREKLLNIKRLKEINCYRGTRHARNLPAHGQRTKTNSRTVRGNVRRTMGSGRKPTAQKT